MTLFLLPLSWAPSLIIKRCFPGVGGEREEELVGEADAGCIGMTHTNGNVLPIP